MVCPACGNSLETPRLRELVRLPVEESDTPASAGWGPRHGVLTAGLLFAAVLAAGGAWFASNEPAPPPPFDAVERAERVDIGLDRMPATDLWKLYHSYYEPMMRQGMQRNEPPHDAALRDAIQASRLYQRVLFIAAGAVAAAAIGLFALLPK